MVSFADIEDAARRIATYIDTTPCMRSRWLSTELKADVRLKLECMQRTGSFKIRGAASRLEPMAGEGRSVIAASAGNHARAVAECAETMKIDATLVMPRTAVATKIAAVRRYKVNLCLAGDSYDESERVAIELASHGDAEFVSPYNDPAVVAGQGTVALEMFDQIGDMDAVFVPAGGGGLLAGMAVASRALSAHCEVIGVQPAAASTLAACFEAGRQVDSVQLPTLADALAGNLEAGSITVPLVLDNVDRFVRVSEADVACAVRSLIDEEHLLVEPAGAVGVAALLAEGTKWKRRRVGVVLTGSAVGSDQLARMLGM
jgi:threonine dehydratase